MSMDILGTLGKIAGIGGIAFGALVLIFRDVIRKKIFPILGADQAFRLLCLILILTFTIALAGIGAWVWVSTHPDPDGRGGGPQFPPPPDPGQDLFLNSTKQQDGPIFGWKPSLPGSWSQWQPMTIIPEQSTWWKGPLPQTINKFEFQTDLHHNQTSVSWVVAPSEDQVSTIAFDKVEKGPNATATFAQSKINIVDNGLLIPPAIEGEHLTVWLEVMPEQSGKCLLDYTFQVQHPDDTPSDPTEQPIFDKLSHSANPNKNDANGCHTKQVVVPHCSPDNLKIGFLAIKPNSDLNINGVMVNKWLAACK